MTKTSRVILGHQGEDLAAEYLQKAGYRVVARNYRTAFGEIDIVARHGPTICFVEVKTRTGVAFGSPAEAVSLPKQRKMAQVAQAFLQDQNLYGQPSRFDVVAVVISPDGPVRVELLQNAFEADE